MSREEEESKEVAEAKAEKEPVAKKEVLPRLGPMFDLKGCPLDSRNLKQSGGSFYHAWRFGFVDGKIQAWCVKCHKRAEAAPEPIPTFPEETEP